MFSIKSCRNIAPGFQMAAGSSRSGMELTAMSKYSTLGWDFSHGKCYNKHGKNVLTEWKLT
jgi:hypothetical protein